MTRRRQRTETTPRYAKGPSTSHKPCNDRTTEKQTATTKRVSHFTNTMAPCTPHVARLHDAPSPRPRQYATSHPVPLDTFPHSNAGDNASRSHQCLETIFTTDSEGTFWATIVLQTATRRREKVRSRQAHRARGRSRERQTASCVSPWRPPAAFQLRQRRAANHTPRQPRQPRQRRHKSVWHSAVGDAGGRLARKRTCASHSLVGQQFSARRGTARRKRGSLER